ncbi:tetratricopeptide repeat protein [Salicola sp. Rm-C-2C1-2]|uniref:tetratricopeptide repeat protein n=1 Tax=Salicola sp. Rm-C-2C1-2 TaxID=3141321 RepID=UPI0032E4DF92
MRKTSLLLTALLLAACAAPTLKDANQLRADGDHKAAAELYRELGNPGARMALYELYRQTGVGFESDAQARAALETLANEHAIAQARYRLGRKLRQERELEAAETHLKAAADAGYQPAIDYLEKDAGLLAREIRIGRSSPKRQKQLADELFEGRNGAPKDRELAAYWYQVAAERGHASAQAMLAFVHFRGEGAGKDPETAYRWYRKAAMQGHVGAQANLGYLYGEGQGTERNLTKAYAWSTLAAENGSPQGQKNQRLYRDAMSNEARLDSLDEIRRLEEVIHGD